MDTLEHLRNSPVLQLLKQLDTTLAFARKTATQFDFIINAGALGTTMRAAQQRQSLQDELVANVRMTIQPQWLSEIASFPTALKAVRQDLARETASMVTNWKSVQQNWVLDATPVARAIEATRRDFAKDITSMAAAWETASMATVWRTAQDAWALDTATIAKALRAAETHNLRIAPAWAASISLERVERARAVFYLETQIQQPDNSLSRKPFGDYGMAESYDLISDFERDLRHFIHQRMSAVFGSKWEKSRIPGEMYKRWLEKRERAILAGELPELLIDYADFTDYVIVITRKDNWEQVFRGFFGRPQFVQESLYRLHPIRVCTMHARLLSQEMRLVLQSEIILLSRRMWN